MAEGAICVYYVGLAVPGGLARGRVDAGPGEEYSKHRNYAAACCLMEKEGLYSVVTLHPRSSILPVGLLPD
jgi:hypothetical protein